MGKNVDHIGNKKKCTPFFYIPHKLINLHEFWYEYIMCVHTYINAQVHTFIIFGHIAKKPDFVYFT